MVKFFHEAPNEAFLTVQRHTDGDYALVHLLDENETYRNHFMEASKKGREIILDNSIFELGTAYNSDAYVRWVETLKPTWFIIPDVLEDCQATLKNLREFKAKYPNIREENNTKTIAVAQGKSYAETLYCFEQLHNDPYVDMVAISFDLSFYEKQVVEAFRRESTNAETSVPEPTRLESWVIGRVAFIDMLSIMYDSSFFYKPVHLLGCALPQEGRFYRDYTWIYSTDTSNPVVAGMEGVRYGPNGLLEKSKTKLFKIIDSPVNLDQIMDIVYNIKRFKSFWEA